MPSDPVAQPAQENNALTLAHYAERAYLEYAISVVKSRALPDVCDGQKPVQRRILYAMEKMGLSFSGASGAKPVKSARVVGDVLGHYHPHSDVGAYDAMVRMAQDFALRYPLIDGQGNFGSRDGDGAAAMRYTEARLAPITRLLLNEINLGTVDFVPNYDGSTQEPQQLPARLPFVLLNGASGIAVGLATEIPSHHLGEVAAAAIALLKNDALSDDELFTLIPGPDFPGGGQIISNPQDIREAYLTGRGSLKVRARWQIEDLARGQWQLVVTELPPATSSAKVLQEVEELMNPKIKLGKKALTAEQLQLKTAIQAVLDCERDEANKNAPVRLVFEPKSRTVNPQELIAALLAHTSLESSCPINLTMIGEDGKPTQKSLRQILTEWISFRLHTVTRRTAYQLDKVQERIHILEGRLLVLLHIDEVIAIIRNSDEPKPALIERYHLSDRQADDILDLRLRQLARLEHIKIEQELAGLRTDETKLQDILNSPTILKRTVIKEIEADAKQYGDTRRTLIQEEKKTTLELKVTDEPVTVIISIKGWIRTKQGHQHDPASFTFKAGDSLYGVFECRSVDTLIIFGTPKEGTARVYSVPVSNLPGGRGDGQPITTLIDLDAGTQPSHYFAGPSTTTLLLTNTHGFGLLARISDLSSRQKSGKGFLSLEADSQLLPPAMVNPEDRYVACLTLRNRLLVFALDELKLQPNGGKGLTLIDALPDDPLLSVTSTLTGVKVLGTGRSNKNKEETLKDSAFMEYVSKRARKGKPVTGLQQVIRLLPLP